MPLQLSWFERPTYNRVIAGSSPAGGTIKKVRVFEMETRILCIVSIIICAKLVEDVVKNVILFSADKSRHNEKVATVFTGAEVSVLSLVLGIIWYFS